MGAVQRGVGVSFDTIIAGGTVVDGLGTPPRRVDIGIAGGRIAEIGDLIDAAASGTADVIDATGRIVTPGFVDVHTHYDGQATWDGLLEPSTQHGVTTLLMGNCGVGFAPVRSDDRCALIELMEGVEDIPGAALSEGLTWGWESFPEYLDVLATRRWSVDVGTQIAHGPVRRFAMGAAAATDAAARDEIATMGRIVRQAIEAGAFGFTTSRTLGHKALDGTPVPGTYASLDELSAIAGAAAAGGARVLEFAAAGLARSDNPVAVAEEFEWVGRLAGDTGVNTTFILLQNHADPERWRREMHTAERWRSSGSPVYPLVAGRPFGVLWGWDVRHPFSARPTYRAIAGLPLAERLVELRDPRVRAAILAEPDEPATRAEAGQLAYIDLVLGDCHVIDGVPDYEQPRRRSIGALAEAQGVSRHEVCYDGLLTDGAMLLYALYNFTSWDHSVLYEQLQDRDTVVGLADGGAHVAFICDASIPTYMLTHWARDRARGPRLDLAEVVRRLTSQPADLYGLADRGRLAVGTRADVNVIDHEHLTLSMPAAVHDLPAGGTRLLQPATGYDLTMVAGEITRHHGHDTGARPGRLLRRA
jgi:N-acyl-D-aspartate/D-glutamate deacylase